MPDSKAAQHSVHPTGGSRHVFKQFVWLEVGSGKVALPRPTHQRVAQAVGYTSWRFLYDHNKRKKLDDNYCRDCRIIIRAAIYRA
jgi:hypothetical protein